MDISFLEIRVCWFKITILGNMGQLQSTNMNIYIDISSRSHFPT